MDFAFFLITLGGLFLLGLTADEIGRFTRMPRVTMLIVLGMLFGQAGFGLVPEYAMDWFEPLSIVALTMVAFLLGGDLSSRLLAERGRLILSVSLAIVVATLLIVPIGLVTAGLALAPALLLAAIATATAPAALTDVIRQSGVKTGFTETLKGIVAIDDGWGLIVFSVVLALAGQVDGWTAVVAGIGRDLGGALLLGGVIGFPAAYLTGRLRPGEPQQAEAIGIVFLTAGLALWLDVSFLITGMTAGALVANLARHHERAFHEIEHIQWPFMLLFFLLAGVTVEMDALRAIGAIGAIYVALRVAGRLAGGWAGARIGGASRAEAWWYGPSLLPQAGVAIGMALVASEAFPQWSDLIMSLTIASTVTFELAGPPAALFAIRRVARAERTPGKRRTFR